VRDLDKLCLKIDVDTHDGMRDGVPALLEDLAHFGIKATFCLSFGPDNAGKAIFRLFTDPAFLKKMLFTGAPRLYGLRTVLSGTILPARPIATSFPGLCRDIVSQGHEVIVHAWDHRKWQDRLADMTLHDIRAEYENAFEAFMEIFSVRPKAVAAPGWQVTASSLAVEDEFDLLYASDLRGPSPCFLRTDARHFSTLQIPTIGPCIEELLAVGVRDEDEMAARLLEPLKRADLPVLAVHAEVEGGMYRPFFRRFLVTLLREFQGFSTMEEAALELFKQKDIPVLYLSSIRIPGRAGKVSSAEKSLGMRP